MQHILDLLPLELRTDGRDLRRELKQSMQWQTPRPEDGLTFVMQRCKAMVEEGDGLPLRAELMNLTCGTTLQCAFVDVSSR